MKKIFLLAVFVLSGMLLNAVEIRGSMFGKVDSRFNKHIQGLACDKDAIYFSFTNYLVKTDWNCGLLKVISIPSHAGDVCLVNGKLYVSCELGKRGGWIYVYDGELNLLEKHNLPEKVNRPDGITYLNGIFYIAQDDFGKELHSMNRIYAFSAEKGFSTPIGVTELNLGVKTSYGIQTMMAFEGEIWCGIYSIDAGFARLKPEPNGKLSIIKIYKWPYVKIGMCPVPEEMAGGEKRFISTLYSDGKVDEEKYWAPAYAVSAFKDGKISSVKKLGKK